MRRLGVAILSTVAAAALGITGFVATATTGSASETPAHHATPLSAPQPAWIISATALSLLNQAGLTGAAERRLFGSRLTFRTGTGSSASDSTVSGVTKTVTFSSYATLRAAVTGNKLPAGTRAVLYDNEAWSLTPAAEQRNPAKYEALAAALVHAHHLLFVSTPATDLTNVLAPGDSNHYAAYLRLGLAASAARHADAIDIQAQGSETDLAKYTAFVRAAAVQAMHANPRVMVLAGISTNPSGQQVTPAQFSAAYHAVRPYVAGFWLNIPAAGTACPRCGTPQPQVAIPLLQSLLAGPHW